MLDLVVDFLTYVFVPAFVVVASGLLPAYLAIPCAIAIIISGALYFADREMKTKDNYFRGFPAVWNVPVFYLFLLGPIRGSRRPQSRCLPPRRSFRFRSCIRSASRGCALLTVGCSALWSVLALRRAVRDMMPGPWVTAGLCAIALYFLAAGLAAAAQTGVNRQRCSNSSTIPMPGRRSSP